MYDACGASWGAGRQVNEPDSRPPDGAGVVGSALASEAEGHRIVLSADTPSTEIGGARAPLRDDGGGAIRAEIVDTAAFLRHAEAWRDLVEAAPEPNVFLEPAILDAAQRADPATPIAVLLAWEGVADGRRLAGAWAFARTGRVFRRLRAPAVPLASLANPVVRPGRAEAVIESWFDLLSESRDWPRILEFEPFADGGPTGEALDSVVARRGGSRRVVARHRRAMLQSSLSGEAYLEETVSGSRRRKLRQLRAKLARQGDVRHTRHAGAAVPEATEQFLELEGRGWKGQRGTAIDANARLTAFTRAMMREMAALGLATVTALTLDGRPISMGLVLQSGRTAYTWKIAYDEAAGAFSPGYLLALEDTATLLADAAIDRTDSCASAETGIMSELWRERIDVTELLLDVRRGASTPFRAMMVLLAVGGFVPELRRRLRLREKLKRFRNRLGRAANRVSPDRS